MRALVINFLGLLSACAVPLGSARQHWHEVQSPHFTVYTDLPARAAQKQTQALEDLLWSLHHFGWEASGDLPVRVNVVMFSDDDEFHQYASPEVGGYAESQVLFEPWIVMPAPTRVRGTEVLTHELTHSMAFQAMPVQPAWLSEGLAGYFQTAKFINDYEFEIGSVPHGLFTRVRVGDYMHPSDLMASPTIERPYRFYPSAWLFVHYLMTRRPDEFVAFQQELARGGTSERAFRAAFREDLAGLDHAIDDYVDAGRYEVFTFRAAPPRAESTSRALSHADELALRALLATTCHGCSPGPERVKRDLALALREQPTHLRAGLLDLFRGRDPDQTYVRARALVEAHPDSWLAWVALGAAAMPTGQYLALVHDPHHDPGANALRLAPNQAFAVMFAAVSHRLRDERALALSTSARAERLQPTNPMLLQIRLGMLTSYGLCTEAKAVAARMRDMGHTQLPADDLTSAQASLMACRDGVAQIIPSAKVK